MTGLDVTASVPRRLQVDVTIATRGTDHVAEVVAVVRTVNGVEIGKVSDRTFLIHVGGMITSESTVPIRPRGGLSMVDAPGVARVCMAIAENPQEARRLTIKRITVAVVTDGSAVLGLGNVGPLLLILTGDDIATMNHDSIVFAPTNPTLAVNIAAASQHAAVVASGRSDVANQINNVLVYPPSISRGLLDAQNNEVSGEVLVAAADALANTIGEGELNPAYIVPSVFRPDVTRVVAAAVRAAAVSPKATSVV